MPEIAVDAQRRERIAHACLVRKGKASGQQAEVRKEICEDGNHACADGMAAGGNRLSILLVSAALQPQHKELPERQQVKRHTAELEGKVPPEVAAAVCKSQQKLFPDLRYRKQNGKDIQEKCLLPGTEAAGLQSQKQRRGEAGQEDKHGKLHSAAFCQAAQIFLTFFPDLQQYAVFKNHDFPVVLFLITGNIPS